MSKIYLMVQVSVNGLNQQIAVEVTLCKVISHMMTLRASSIIIVTVNSFAHILSALIIVLCSNFTIINLIIAAKSKQLITWILIGHIIKQSRSLSAAACDRLKVTKLKCKTEKLSNSIINVLCKNLQQYRKNST